MAPTNQVLTVIPMRDWSILRDLYHQNWPQHIFTYYTLANYAEWARKDAAMCERDLRVTSVDEQWREHGTHILEDNNRMCNTIILSTTAPQHNAKLLTILRSLQLDPFCMLLYSDISRPAAEQFLHELGVKDFSNGYCPTTLYRLPNEECRKLELNAVPGFVVKPLSLQHAKHIDSAWSHKYPGSDYCIEREIRHNIAVGAFDVENDNLCAWVVHSQHGTIAVLQVEDAYRRRGLAEHLVRFICSELGAQGADAITTIMDANTASTGLFRKLGFQPVDHIYWFELVELNKTQKVSGEQSIENRFAENVSTEPN